MLELARDLAHGKEMSLLFSSHLLPDVEFVCDHVLVLAQGRLLAQGQIQELKDLHDHCYEVRVKADAKSFARRLGEAGCTVTDQDHSLLVRSAAGAVGTDALGAGRRRGRADPPPAAAAQHA